MLLLPELVLVNPVLPCIDKTYCQLSKSTLFQVVYCIFGGKQHTSCLHTDVSPSLLLYLNATRGEGWLESTYTDMLLTTLNVVPSPVLTLSNMNDQPVNPSNYLHHDMVCLVAFLQTIVALRYLSDDGNSTLGLVSKQENFINLWQREGRSKPL